MSRCGSTVPQVKSGSGCSGSSGKDHQRFPSRGHLARNLDLTLDELVHDLSLDNEQSGAETVYCYIVDSVHISDELMQQRGSGPNIEGGVITLCTCKHWMRSYRDAKVWESDRVWIAGFTGKNRPGPTNRLFYLMRVGASFESQCELWNAVVLTDDAKKAKSASRNRLGDLFEPLASGNPFDPSSYRKPVDDHSHIENLGWHKDIDYVGCGKRQPALLVGDKNDSYLWRDPKIEIGKALSRGQKKMTMNEFFEQIREV